MKLIETPINSNIDLETLYPNITQFVLGKKAIKFYKRYSLDRTQIFYLDVYDKIDILMIGTKKKVSKQEIDCVIKRLLHSTREEVEVFIDVKKQMENKHLIFNDPVKDIVVIQKQLDETE